MRTGAGTGKDSRRGPITPQPHSSRRGTRAPVSACAHILAHGVNPSAAASMSRPRSLFQRIALPQVSSAWRHLPLFRPGGTRNASLPGAPTAGMPPAAAAHREANSAWSMTPRPLCVKLLKVSTHHRGIRPEPDWPAWKTTGPVEALLLFLRERSHLGPSAMSAPECALCAPAPMQLLSPFPHPFRPAPHRMKRTRSAISTFHRS